MDLKVIDDTSAALAALDPLRNRILAAPVESGSASTVAATLGLSRQKINYHIRILEDLGLVEMEAELPRRGLTERIMIASARSYLLPPAVLGLRLASVSTGERDPVVSPSSGWWRPKTVAPVWFVWSTRALVKTANGMTTTTP